MTRKSLHMVSKKTILSSVFPPEVGRKCGCEIWGYGGPTVVVWSKDFRKCLFVTVFLKKKKTNNES